MPVAFKDYYETLGVPRTATQDEIQRAFRKLARKYHPDVAKDKTNAAEKFKEINEANEVLGDPEKRKKYDALGANWKQGEPFRPQPGASGPFGGQRAPGGTPEDFEFEFGGTGFSDFFENIFGTRGGGGDEIFSHRGRDVEADLMVTIPEALHGSTRPVSLRRAVVCDRCRGTGQVQGKLCPQCGGQGHILKTESYQVKIPAGVYEGQVLRLGGQGEAGAGAGQKGDLFLRVRFAQPPEHRIENSNLVYDLDLPPWDTALGTSVSVPLLDGHANLKIPPGTQNEQRLRLKGHGMPQRGGGRGDLFVTVHIKMPEHVTERQRTLWEQLRREANAGGGS